METIKVQQYNKSTKQEYTTNEVVYNVHDFPYNMLFLPRVKGKNKGFYYNVSCAFDIETTTIEPPKDANGDYITPPYSFMYQWQFCIQNKVIFGRTWDEFILLLNTLQEKLHLHEKNILVCYVHNFAFEFQHMKDFVEITQLFAKEKRKPLYMQVKQGIEFRCSYFLSNMSLSKFCENSELCTYYKMIDTYDYRKIRTPKTELTESEKSYCYNDVRGLCQCIDTMLQEDNITTIPLTNTGFVRREFRRAITANEKNRDEFVKSALTVEQYEMLRKAFRGGNTHASRYFANKIIHDVYSYDIQSSYPAVEMLTYMPIGKFMPVEITEQQDLDYYIQRYCVLMEIELHKPRVKAFNPIPYIDIAHCEERSNIVNDNGRVLSADYIKLTITEIDLNIIRETYDYDGFEVVKAFYCERGEMNKEFKETLMHFYTLKTQLKGISDMEYEYMKSKNRVNSSFGMCVTDILHTEIEYLNDTMKWIEKEPDKEKALIDFYKSRNNFLSYQQGVWITAQARRRLQDMLNRVGIDVIYIDTDSIKFINKDHLQEFEEMNISLIEQCEQSEIPAFADKDGKRYYLGVWDRETDMPRFKTLGAKKYAYETINKNDNSVILHTTVSGMSKKKGAKAVGTLENFEIGKTYYDIGRTTSWYNDVKPHIINVDNVEILTASNIGIVDTTYTLGITNEYWDVLKLSMSDIMQ